jgi:dGTPase
MARMLDLNEDLVEVLADSHDLGHPPFAHSGQVALEKLMQPHGGFEHNAQSRRIVEFLESKSAQYPGLNLAYETLFGLMKHAGAEQIKSMIGADQFYFPLEAEVVDLADEIAYNNHDLEDGLSSGLLSFDDIKTVPLWRENIERLQKNYPGIDEKNLRKALVSDLIGTQIIQVVKNSLSNIEKFNFQKPQDANRISADKVIAFDPREYVAIAECRKYLYQNFYFHPKVQGMNERAEQIISGLFKFYETHPEKLEFKGVPEAPFYRRLCDYIAGMTDGYAEKMYQKYCL